MLSVTDYYIVSISTIWNVSNNLLGYENLKTIYFWKKYIKNQGYTIIKTIKMYSHSSILKRLNTVINIFPSGDVIFVIKKHKQLINNKKVEPICSTTLTYGAGDGFVTCFFNAHKFRAYFKI